MTPAPTDVERVARAMAFSVKQPNDASRDADEYWHHTGEHGRATWMIAARAAIAAMQPSVAQAAKVLSQSELPSYVVEMPITASGNGPATVGFDAARMTYEVWDAATLNTIGDPHSLLSDANRAWLRALSKETPDA